MVNRAPDESIGLPKTGVTVGKACPLEAKNVCFEASKSNLHLRGGPVSLATCSTGEFSGKQVKNPDSES